MTLFEKLSDYLRKERDLAELGKIEPHVLTDLAMDPAALRHAILSRPRVRAQMTQMAARFGLTEADITTPHWREMDLLNACQNCRGAKQCARFLDGKSTKFGVRDCPNGASYTEIADQKAKSNA